MSTVFIGDLHLSEDRPDITLAFKTFLADKLTGVEALYIIGDLFEVWVGDDIAPDFAVDIAQSIAAIAKQIPVYFIHGNRDFLIGEHFCQLSGMTMLAEVHTINLYGVPSVILHGDSLCTLDKSYQRFRTFRNIGLVKWLYCHLPQKKRLNIATNIRQKSKQGNQNKSYQVMDVEPNAVINLLNQTATTQMIHGHTHRPDIHHLNDNKTRIVVGDWYEQGSALYIDENGYKLTSFGFNHQNESA
ncbi:UDP-2,3-diacylglucosamine diphosphatase [Shewanella intestini]|uniref:UDP-2,3-diacylglucosamine hydrolase n=1 Tax=Shewanella intestini TaxID=2017544 RepID=A0ABS5I6E2_9GAMM|nr:UDP-2,3-diacylglucosamine diphosphatase [Shewanella sp. XMDDZSB0408]MBR9729284.1 UDP-2,3-diacylglucosamine diphosphatase [Shewanella intestini]MRG35429.1 UDP-2,3-diacylglucosamine diphosphatase [Shewanella sp. XMDDZSB0408]